MGEARAPVWRARARRRLARGAVELAARVAPTALVLAAAGCSAFAGAAVASASPARTSGAAPACAPATLNTSAALAGGAVTVSPAPESRDASYETQISFLGLPASEIENVAVSGSASGPHAGRLEAYSQGDGASFLPSARFAQGEVVTVKAALRGAAGLTPIEWHFTVAEVDSVSRSLETPPAPPPRPKESEHQHFVSRRGLEPPTVTVAINTHQQTQEDIFLGPYAGPGQYGPMILDSEGNLIWFRALAAGARAGNFRVQRYEGSQVLTWWQDPAVSGGRRESGDVIANSSYQDLAVVRAGNGYQPDLHAFEITPQGTALMTVYDAIRCNLSAYGGPADGAIADTLVQEVDLRTGLVRFEWHNLDHVPLSASYMPIAPGGTAKSPWDAFHINMVEALPDGDLLINSRNAWAAYDVDERTGEVRWTLGGKDSSFAIGTGAGTAWQHDAQVHPNGTISMFDNGATPQEHQQSRAIVLAVDEAQMTVSLLASFVHPDPLLVAESQGDAQSLASGDWFVGWGQQPYFSEFSPQGRLLFDAHIPGTYQSYTVLKFDWSGTPAQPPAVAVRPRAGRSAVVYVSWNGATGVARWRVLGGSRRTVRAQFATVARRGFETAIALKRAPRYLEVQALGSAGQVLGVSATVSSR